MLSTSEAGRTLCSSCLSLVPRKTSMGSREKSGPPWLPKKDSEPVYLQEPRPEHHPLPQAKKNLVLGFKPGSSEPSAAACEVAGPRVQRDCTTERRVSSPLHARRWCFLCPASICPVQGVMSAWHEKSRGLDATTQA